MAKTYGERWVLGNSLGSGGQGEVFYATDRSGEITEAVALKRLKNQNRAERFIREIEAIRSVDHQHVIKLIDHSSVNTADKEQPMFIVMPLAAGGDLSKRVLTYKDSLDSTLIVAQQLASALAAAHSAGVIHRDVKPQNILFQDGGHHSILTDFGICYMHADERVTPMDEAVGPRVFMSPEMEGGRVIEVRQAADVYSLGKLIYYMISGGVMLPREAIHEAQYASIFAESGRYHLLKMLLGKMICVEDRRLKTMHEVIVELDQIASWESRAQVTPLSSSTFDALRKLQQRELETQRITAANDQARKSEGQILSEFTRSFTEWLNVELRQIRDAVHVPGIFECSVLDAAPPGRLSDGRQDGFLEPMPGVELRVTRPQNTFNKVESLQFFLCRVRRMVFQMGNQPREQPFTDTELTFLPYYLRPVERPQANGWQGFLTTSSGRKVHSQGRRGAAVPHVHRTFIGANYTIFRKFRVSQWPSIRADISADIGEAFATFSDYLLQGATSIGS
ncbi:protein kinase [Rhodanobacter sp. 7MK24]|uniref:protein kinase domain-containing protein n=1 Tax=Rhodanobacter sp. 7MK24 TaxID=2775922 RepID=UPI00177B1FF9|nr:protein kinase [Rhodanobacter sp. 7MK24]MBD8880110.1 protein kinase [Rhodanobacter sp. 7MK24]